MYLYSAFWTTAKNVTDAFARAKLMPIAFKIGETKVLLSKIDSHVIKKKHLNYHLELYIHIINIIIRVNDKFGSTSK